ncbi:hypothetical protein WJX72_006073 [[Myrmecia] bisecta]|uniref:Uncharacterized protein n=1 Tax=[Myrmecia] bisecta TaxID=41462 RepID=A0AAW1QRP4_9CHLO
MSGNPTTAQRLAEKVPGTSEHAATHSTRGTGLDGVGQAVKEHLPGSNQMDAGAAGYGSTAGATGTGSSAGGTDPQSYYVADEVRTHNIPGHVSSTAGNWAGGSTGKSGTGTNIASNDMTTAQKLKSMVPGTTEHALKKEEQERGL